MDDQRIVISSALAVTPDTVRDREFTSAFRGYQPSEVRQFLRRVAEELAAAAEREGEARRSMHEALARAAHPQLDEASLTTALGEHTARLFASARETAAGITADAEKTASAMLRDAEARVARMRQDAEDIVTRRLEEADAAGGNLRQTAHAEVRTMRDQAEAEAEAAVQSARAQGKEMVAEAREVRERMLSDLSRRRRAAQVQLEQLRVARERLLAALGVVRRTLDEATDELQAAEPEARLAAEEVAREMTATGASIESADDLLDSNLDRAAPEPSPFVSPIITKVSAPLGTALSGSRPSVAGLGEAGSLGAAARAAGLRPPLRPQSVVESVPRAVSSLPGHDPSGELATGEIPAVSRHGPPVVEALFARIRADRAPGTDGDGGESEDAPAEAPEVGAPVSAREVSGHDVGAHEVVEADSPEVGVPEQVEAQEGSEAAKNDTADEAALAARDQMLDPLDSAIVRALKRVLRDEQNEVLDRLRRLAGSAVAEAVPTLDEQRLAFRTPVAPLLAEAAKAGGAEVEAAVAEGWADALADTLISPLRERLDRTLSPEAEGNGDSEAAEGVRLAYRQCRLSEIDPLVRHHTAAAFSRGAFTALADGALMRWVVDDDGSCPDCDDNALAGATAKGEDFPTGQPYPPAHPGCRCLLVPAS